MQSIAQDAHTMSLLMQFGVRTGSDIIAWSDSLIAQLDSPTDILLELSMTAPDKTANIVSCLNRLSLGSDFLTAFRSALPLIREFLILHPDRAEGIANHLFRACCQFGYEELPKDLRFVYHFDDAFSLAREGTYSNTRTVYREFVDELGKHTQVA
jgi:hypothetical protein